MSVFVLGADNLPLMPCTEKRARLLLDRKRAYVVRHYPFIIRMKGRSQEDCEFQDLEVKIDPGSVTTGFCLSRTKDKVVNVVQLMELTHRGREIKKKMKQRAMYRRARRQRNTRYRQARFLNRVKPKGWLPPSLQHRVDSTMSWIKRYQKWSPVTSLAIERVKFDTQKLQNADIEGIEYQQGTLFNYEIKEYLLEKWNRTCMYCDEKETTLEIEHIVACSRGGSNRISNLGLAYTQCNQLKGNMLIEEFLKKRPDHLAKVLKQLKKPLKDAAMMNATRNALLRELEATGFPVMSGTGAETKRNRSRFKIPKTHALDAACVGQITGIEGWKNPNKNTTNIKRTMEVKCGGRGRYRRTQTDKYGFPRSYLMKSKFAFGFRTGDIAVIKRNDGGKNYIGKISIRERGSFSTVVDNKVVTRNHKWFILRQKYDGYNYHLGNGTVLNSK